MTETERKIRCRGCHRRLGVSACTRCIRTCLKKQRYVSRETAELILIEMRGQPWDDPRLHPYRCRIGQDHFHLGHASGRDARRLKHRHEKARRKALIAGLDLQQR